MKLLRRLDQWVTPRRVAITLGALLIPLTVLLGLALIRGDRVAVYAAWIVWALDAVATVTLTVVHYADRRHARRQAELEMTKELSRIVDDAAERIGGLY